MGTFLGVVSIVYGLTRFVWGVRAHPGRYHAAVGLGYASMGASFVAGEMLSGTAALVVTIVFAGVGCLWFGFGIVLMRRERRSAAR